MHGRPSFGHVLVCHHQRHPGLPGRRADRSTSTPHCTSPVSSGPTTTPPAPPAPPSTPDSTRSSPIPSTSAPPWQTAVADGQVARSTVNEAAAAHPHRDVPLPAVHRRHPRLDQVRRCHLCRRRGSATKWPRRARPCSRTPGTSFPCRLPGRGGIAVIGPAAEADPVTRRRRQRHREGRDRREPRWPASGQLVGTRTTGHLRPRAPRCR